MDFIEVQGCLSRFLEFTGENTGCIIMRQCLSIGHSNKSAVQMLGGGGRAHVLHGRSGTVINPHVLTMPEWSPLGYSKPSRRNLP